MVAVLRVRQACLRLSLSLSRARARARARALSLSMSLPLTAVVHSRLSSALHRFGSSSLRVGLDLEKIALEKESFVTSFGYMSIVIESGERGDS